MTVRPVRLRELAASDLEDAADYYQEPAGASTALDFIDAVHEAVEHIRTNPGIGMEHGLDECRLAATGLAEYPAVGVGDLTGGVGLEGIPAELGAAGEQVEADVCASPAERSLNRAEDVCPYRRNGAVARIGRCA